MRPLSIDVAPSAPELPVPVFEFQIPKLLVKHPTAFPFQISHKAGYAHFGRALHKHMDMICAAYSFHNPYTFPLTQLSQNTAYCSTPLSVEYLSSVYWRKNDVIFTVPLGVRPHSPPLPFDFLSDTCSCQTAGCFNKSKGFFCAQKKPPCQAVWSIRIHILYFEVSGASRNTRPKTDIVIPPLNHYINHPRTEEHLCSVIHNTEMPHHRHYQKQENSTNNAAFLYCEILILQLYLTWYHSKIHLLSRLSTWNKKALLHLYNF